MTSKKKIAVTAIEAAAPELAIPAEALSAILSRREAPPPPSAQLQGDVVLVPPPAKPLLLELQKARVSVRIKKGVRIVEVHPAKGLTAEETILASALIAAGYGAYVVAKWLGVEVQHVEKAFTPPSWTNPFNWKL